MQENEIKRLMTLRNIYKDSEVVCDPIEYQMRKKTLLHAIVKTLLEPLEEYEYEQKKTRKR